MVNSSDAEDNDISRLYKMVNTMSMQIVEMQRQLSILRSDTNGLKIFALDCSRKYGEEIASNLGLQLSPHIEKYHPDGEVYVRPLANVRRSHVFVVANLSSDLRESVNDKLQKVESLVGALWDASAEEITLVAPYLPYARSDRKVKSREPVINKYQAHNFQGVHLSRLMTMDVHSLQGYQNAYSDCRTDNLEFRLEFTKFLANRLRDVPPTSIGILSPDRGSFQRCSEIRDSLCKRLGNGIGIAWLDKCHDRIDDNKKSATTIIGDVKEIMVIYDDLIATAGTACLAVDTAMRNGAKEVWLAATHGLCVGEADERLLGCPFSRLILSDTIPPVRLSQKNLERLEVLPTTKLFAEAIRRTYTGESLSSLFDD